MRLVTLARLVSLAAYWLGLSVVWGALTTIVLPVLVERAVGSDVKGTALALVAAGQAVVAIVVQPVSGAWSDRAVTRFGRRRPWIVVGVAAQLIVLVAILPGAVTLPAIVATMLLLELVSNTAQGPYQGLLPDLVPRGRRGLASGVLGAAQLVGQVAGVALAGLAVAAGRLDLAILLGAGALALGTAWTVLGSAEAASDVISGSRPNRASAIASLREATAAAWGRDVLGQRAYLWVLASRLSILTAAGSLQPFVYFYLKDSVGLGGDAAGAVAPVAGLVAITALLGAIPGGVLTTRVGRVTTVAASAGLGAIGAAAFAVAPTFGVVFAVAAPFGMALGIFLAADWALIADLAPDGEAGRYLGLSNTATALAGLLAVAIGGPAADLLNRSAPGLGFRAIFVLAAIEFVVGGWCVRHVPETAALDAPRPTAGDHAGSEALTAP